MRVTHNKTVVGTHLKREKGESGQRDKEGKGQVLTLMIVL